MSWWCDMHRTSASSLGKRDPDGGIGSKGSGRRERVGGNGSEGSGRRERVRGIRIGDFTKKISKSTNLFCCFIRNHFIRNRVFNFFLSEKGRVYKKLSTCFRSLVWISYKKNCVGLSKVLEYKLCINGYDWTTWQPLLIQSFLWLFWQEKNSLPLGTIMLISYFV